jgi:hypothetical protein
MPRKLTDAAPVSSHLPLPHLETIDDADLSPGLP